MRCFVRSPTRKRMSRLKQEAALRNAATGHPGAATEMSGTSLERPAAGEGRCKARDAFRSQSAPWVDSIQAPLGV